MPDAQKKLCFVVGPIGTDDSDERTHADWLFHYVIGPEMEKRAEFETKRADHFATPGMIDAQVIKSLLEAELVIADLSTLNPNAFYEIGIRHMRQLPIIHMQLATEKTPFDVSLYRAIKYSLKRPVDIAKARAALNEQLSAVLAPEYQVDNPVTRARGVVKLEEGATSTERVLLNRLEALEYRLSTIEGLPAPEISLKESSSKYRIIFRSRLEKKIDVDRIREAITSLDLPAKIQGHTESGDRVSLLVETKSLREVKDIADLLRLSTGLETRVIPIRIDL